MSLRIAVAVFLAGSLLSPWAVSTNAQVIAPGLDQAPQNTSYPNDQYYLALEIYREGNLENAFEAFEQALGRCRRDVNGRWIDAIPVHAMLGECFYQAGDLPAAVEQIDAALALVVRNRGWLTSLDWNDVVSVAVRVPDRTAAWAMPNVPNLLSTNGKMKLATGTTNVEASIRAGGVFENARLTSIDAIEIMRGVAIASYRRRIIYGSLSNQSEMANQALDATKYPSGLNAPIPRAIIGAMRGCERFASKQDQEMFVDANRSSSVGGSIHPLTPMILLASARATAQTDKFADAVPIAIQAAIAASAFRQPEWVAEAFLIAAGCVDKKSAPVLVKSAADAALLHSRQGRFATPGSLLAAAEASLVLGDISGAQVALTQAGTYLQRRDMQQPRWSAQGEYVTALAAAQSGESFGLATPSVIDAAMGRLITFTSGNGPTFRRANTAQRRSNGATPSVPRLFQRNIVAALAQGRGVDGKIVVEKLSEFAGEPSAAVWRADPVDAIAYASVDQSPLINAQIVSAVKRSAINELLPLIDAYAREKFLSTQSLGGRVLQVRRLAATEPALLTKSAAEARAKPADPLLKMIDILATPMPAVGTEPMVARGRNLESLASWMALQRVEIPGAAPPVISGMTDLTRLAKDDGMLMFADVGPGVVAVLAVNGKVTSWNITPAKAVTADIAKVLKEIGVASNRSTARLEGESTWKAEATTLRRRLIPDEQLSAIESLKSLVIVPTGPLWYLPMDLLPLGGEDAPTLGEKVVVRYSPTPGLALYPVSYAHLDRPIGVVPSLFFAPRDGDANSQMVEAITSAMKTPLVLPGSPIVPAGLLGETMGAIAVLGVTSPNVKAPFAFAPAGYDAADPQGTLAAWLRFPSKVPRGVFLFGYRTAAPSPTLGDGQEIFLTLTALHCAGVRDIVMSRWAVGGESTSSLAKEFLQELPFEGIQSSWQRAVQALQAQTLNPKGEVLLGTKDLQREEVSGDHPLFWSGYLIDSPASPAGP